MNHKIDNIGVDIVSVSRFDKYAKNRDSKFLLNNFTKRELDYCFAYKNASIHLAGTFAAKEAVWKSLGQTKLLMSLIEIRRNKVGQPTVWLDNRQQKSVLISISHESKIAVAFAIKV